MKNSKDYNLMDILKFNSGYSLGWKISRLKDNVRLSKVMENIQRYNPRDSFCEGMSVGIDNGRNQQKKTDRLSELDKAIEQSKENQKDLDLER